MVLEVEARNREHGDGGRRLITVTCLAGFLFSVFSFYTYTGGFERMLVELCSL